MSFRNDTSEKVRPWEEFTSERTLSEYYAKQNYFMLKEIKALLLKQEEKSSSPSYRDSETDVSPEQVPF